MKKNFYSRFQALGELSWISNDGSGFKRVLKNKNHAIKNRFVKFYEPVF